MNIALAYLDPGAGSMFLQVVLASILGLGITIKTYGRRIAGFFRSKKADTASTSKQSPTRDPH